MHSCRTQGKCNGSAAKPVWQVTETQPDRPGFKILLFADGPHSRLFFHLQDPSYFSPSCAAHGNPKLLPALGNLLHPATKGLSGLWAELS